MKRLLISMAVIVGASALAADRHVYLDTDVTAADLDGDNQLNDCPNPAHNAKGTNNTDELEYCSGGTSAGKIIGTVTGTVSSGTCTGGGGTVAALTNNSLVDIDRDGTNERVYGHPQACVYNMAKSDSCEVHAGTYRQAGASCSQNCGDFSTASNQGSAGFGTCHDFNCWLGSVAAFGFGPNLDGTGYGTAANPGYLRAAVMNGSTDTWDTNGDKVADGSYSAILSGDRDAGGVGDFDQTTCSGTPGVCSGDTFRAVTVGCGGSYAGDLSGKQNCTLTPEGSEEYVKIDSDANGTFDVSLDARTLAPCPGGTNNCTSTNTGTRPVDHFIVKDIEFTGYNQGALTVDGGGRALEANFTLNGDGSSDGLKLDHIYMHDNSYGVEHATASLSSVRHETYHAHIVDMHNAGCVDFVEVKNSYLEQNNRLLFGDEGSAAYPSLGCSWRIHDNRILVNVKGFNSNAIPGLFFFKSIDNHLSDQRPKTIRFYNNEVIIKQTAIQSVNGSAVQSSVLYGFQFGQFGTSGTGNGFGLGKGEFWMYGNIFRVHSSPTTPLFDQWFTRFIDIDCTGCSTSWRVYYFNNTWDAWSSSTSVLLGGFARSTSPAVGELFVGKNNVEVFTTEEPSTLTAEATPNATTKTFGNNVRNTNANDASFKCGSGSTAYFACTGGDPLTGSGLAYYAPKAGGALIGTGSCDPDGDGTAGFDTDGDGDQDSTWTDIAGNLVSCPSVSTPIAIGAIQSASAPPPAPVTIKSGTLRRGSVR